MDGEVVQEVVQEVVENITEAVNGTAREPASPEGVALAYASLMGMALFPIFLGSFRSIRYHEQSKAAGEKMDTVTSKDAAMFPILASCALFGLYMVFKIFSKEYINLLLGSYFFFLGVFAMSHVFSSLITGLVPSFVPRVVYHLKLTKPKTSDEQEDEVILDYEFSTHDCVCIFVCSLIGGWYLLQKHWVANNLLGLAFAINGIELMSLNSVQTGALLLGGLFLYDIFWVFGTEVMVTVAKSFDAPIKLLFPQDLLEKGLGASNFAMLGLGDIVIPGIFIALVLRFDKSLNRGTNSYFYATFIAYIAGLASTIFVMHIFKHAQPALLYLVPACLGFPTFLSIVKGDFSKFIRYEDETNDDEAEPDQKPVEKETEDTEVTRRVTRANTRKDK